MVPTFLSTGRRTLAAIRQLRLKSLARQFAGNARPGLFISLTALWLLVAAGLTAARFADPGFGVQGDLPIHYYLAKAFTQALQDGDWLPRWAGSLDGGRGDAVFTFYAPLFYWINSGLTRLLGLQILTAFKCLIFFSCLLAQFGAYLLAREFFGVRASVVAAVAWVILPACPHLLLHRGFLPNSLALGLAPLALLGACRLLMNKAPSESGWQAGSLALFSLSFGAIILTHPITTYLCAWAIVFMTLCCWPQAGWKGLKNLAAGVALALALTAFFLVPQFIEMGWVRAGLEITQHNYHDYFLFAEAADASSYRRGWAELNQVVSLLTLTQTVLAGLLLITSSSLLRQTNRRWLWRWLFTLTAIGLLISLPVSDLLWRWIPGLKFIQFPWRFQPLVSLAIGLSAAATIEGWHSNRRHPRLLAAATVTWLVLLSLAFTFLLARPPGRTLSQADVQLILHPPHAVPLSAQQVNELREKDDLSHLAYVANRVPFRPAGADFMLYPPAELPGGASIIAGRGKIVGQELKNSHRSFRLKNDEPVRVRIDTYFYPNWAARLDGQSAYIAVEPGSGLMLIDVPAGEHTLQLTFETHGAGEWLARLVSGFACLTLLLSGRKRTRQEK